MKTLKRIAVTGIVIIFMIALVPVSAFAVDPVSAATMANAFAQAITAYGASQGVSMTFDVTSTDGIGEGVHDLWNQYQSDMANSSVTVSDYQNLAASAFPSLWSKTFQYITVNLDAATVGEVDGFWDWLLSGPAQMIKVDNQYYEWTLNQNNTVDPINVLSLPLYSSINYAPYSQGITAQAQYESSTAIISASGTYVDNYRAYSIQSGNSIYCFAVPDANNIYFVSQSSGASTMYCDLSIRRSNNEHTYGTGSITQLTNTHNNLYYYRTGAISGNNKVYYCDTFSSEADGFAALESFFADPSGDYIDVRPYVGDAVPQDVYIPDNQDVNYAPLPVSIPLDINWDDSLFGDGTNPQNCLHNN